MEKQETDYPGILLITIFLSLLSYAGFLAYKSIDWQVLDRLEQSPIVIPTPAPASGSGVVNQNPSN